MKRNISYAHIIICWFFTLTASAQMNRGLQANNIATNIYENSSHAITGFTLEQVMLNQNNSYVNVLSDTNLLDVRNFSPYAVYTPGMGCFHNDTLYRNITAVHGSWNQSQWQAITGTSLGCFILCSDTGKSVVTYHALDSAFQSHCFITCSDTGRSVVTYHALDSAFNSHCFLACADTLTKVASLHTVSSDISIATSPLMPFADTTSLITTHHEVAVVAASVAKYSDTAASGGTGLISGPKIATPHFVSIATASLIPFSDTTSIIVTQNQLAAKSGGIQLLSKCTINLDTTADQSITLNGGTTFVITDIVITNVSVTPISAAGGQWWSAAGRTGNQYALTVEANTPFETLISPGSVINTFYNTFFHPGQMITFPVLGGGSGIMSTGSTLYFSLGTANGSACNATMYIYGYVLN